MSKFYHPIFFLVGICMILTYLLHFAPSDIDRPSSSDVLEYVKKREFGEIDVILLQPFVEHEKSNYSLLSLMRFAPWIRRIHFQDAMKTHDDADKLALWKKQRFSRVVYFHEDLLHYSLTTSHLAEQFLILRSGYLVTNYIFPWQFFMNGSPILRFCGPSLVPMTRTILNLGIYKPNYSVESVLLDARRQGLIKHEASDDHFVPPCSKSPYTSVRYVPSYDPNAVRNYFTFEQVDKNRETPFKLIITFADNANDDLNTCLPEDTLTLWIYCNTSWSPSERLSFLARRQARSEMFIELERQGLEQMGVVIMKSIETISNGQAFKIVNVISRAGHYRLANRIAQTYDSPYTSYEATESLKKPITQDLREFHRLQML